MPHPLPSVVRGCVCCKWGDKRFENRLLKRYSCLYCIFVKLGIYFAIVEFGMILVDTDIKKLIDNKTLIVEGFDEAHLKGIAYELSINSIIDAHGSAVASYDLQPGETVYIKSQEKISLPKNIVGTIVERNSVMRQGLKVDGPCYIPGHETYCFLRVHNLTNSVFSLIKGFAIAQIMFEQLQSEPQQTYDKQEGASFANETEYKGLGKYANEYDKLTKRFDDAKESLESLKERIYGNVLTLMGIIVAIFSLLTIDFQLVAKNTDLKSLVTINLSLAVSISVLMGIILIFLNKAKNKRFLAAYILILVALIIALLIISIF